MPKVISKDIDSVNAKLTVSIPVSDYKPAYEGELKKLRQKIDLKGFRKGKAPLGLVKKMYGEQVLMKLINELLDEEVNKFLQEDKDTKYLGQPIPSEDSPVMEFNLKDLKDYEFKLDLGKAPDVELKGLDKKSKYSKYTIKIEKKIVDEGLEALAKRFGEEVEVDEPIKEGDRIRAIVTELDGKKAKEGGLVTSVVVLVDDMDEDIKKKVLKKKKGDTIKNINIYKLDKQLTTKEDIDEHLLGLEEGEEVGENFDFTIDEVIRIKPAELNQELFDKAFGEGVVSSKKEAIEKIKEPLIAHFDRQADFIFAEEVREKLLKKNEFEMPVDFLKRWILMSDGKMTEEELKEQLPVILESLRWDLIQSMIAKSADISVSHEEVEQDLIQKIEQYYGGANLPEGILNSLLEGILKDENEYRRVVKGIYDAKVMGVIAEKVKIEDKPVSVEEFEKVIKAFNEKRHEGHDHNHDHQH